MQQPVQATLHLESDLAFEERLVTPPGCVYAKGEIEHAHITPAMRAGLLMVQFVDEAA
jgi:hypothetical protein